MFNTIAISVALKAEISVTGLQNRLRQAIFFSGASSDWPFRSTLFADSSFSHHSTRIGARHHDGDLMKPKLASSALCRRDIKCRDSAFLSRRLTGARPTSRSRNVMSEKDL